MLNRDDKQFNRQLKALIEKLRENPSELEDCLEVAKFYFLGEDYDKAIRVEKEILKLLPNDLKVLYNLSICLRANGAREEATEVLRKILSIDPNHEGASKALEDITKME